MPASKERTPRPACNRFLNFDCKCCTYLESLLNLNTFHSASSLLIICKAKLWHLFGSWLQAVHKACNSRPHWASQEAFRPPKQLASTPLASASCHQRSGTSQAAAFSRSQGSSSQAVFTETGSCLEAKMQEQCCADCFADVSLRYS